MNFVLKHSNVSVDVPNDVLLIFHNRLLSLRNSLLDVDVFVVDSSKRVFSLEFDVTMAMLEALTKFISSDFNSFVKSINLVSCVSTGSVCIEEEEDVEEDELCNRKRVYPFRKNVKLKSVNHEKNKKK